MAKAQKRIACDVCPVGRIEYGSPFCRSCGTPTVWATHQDRIEWEVGQWRKTRGDTGRQAASRSPFPMQPAVEAVFRAETAAARLAAPIGVHPTERSSGPSVFARILAALRRVREAFAASSKIALDLTEPFEVRKEPSAMTTPVSGPPEPPPVTLHIVPATESESPGAIPDIAAAEPEAAVEAAVAEPVASAVEFAAEAAPNPVALEPEPVALAAPRASAAPRKRPQRPTNKDLLKRALDVLTKVEERLEHLEVEVAGLEATRAPSASDAPADELAVEDYLAF